MSGLQFDKAIRRWYFQNGRDYNQQYSKYLQSQEYFDEKGNIEDELCEEFKMKICDVNEELIYADPNFPVPSWLNLQKQQKNQFIFNVLRYCFQYKKCPTNAEMIDEITSCIAEEYNIQKIDMELVLNCGLSQQFDSTERFYNYIQLITTLSIYHQNMFQFNTKMGTIGIINYNLYYSKKKPIIYGVILCGKKTWKLAAFMSGNEIKRKYNIHYNKLLNIPSYFCKGYTPVSQHSHKKHISNNTNNKPRRGKKLKKKKARVGNTYNSCRFDVKQTIDIPATLTNKYGIIAYTVRESYANIYEYICKLIPLLINTNIDDLQIGYKIELNCGFTSEETSEPLFLVLERQNENDNKGYKLRMHNKLYKAQELTNKIPMSIKSKVFKQRQQIHRSKIEAVLSDDGKRQTVIGKCPWTKIDIFNKVNKRRRVTYSIDKPVFIAEVNQYMNNNSTPLIPILMFNDSNDGYAFEFISIVSIEDGICIGISFSYNEKTQRVIVNSIHIDKEYIMNQHQLISAEHNNECKCLEQFKSTIQVLKIGNVDNDKNRAEQFEKETKKLREFIRRDIIQNPAVAAISTANGGNLVEAAKAACSNSNLVEATKQQSVPNIINQYYYSFPLPLSPQSSFFTPNAICNSNGYIAPNTGKNMTFPALPFAPINNTNISPHFNNPYLQNINNNICSNMANISPSIWVCDNCNWNNIISTNICANINCCSVRKLPVASKMQFQQI